MSRLSLLILFFLLEAGRLVGSGIARRLCGSQRLLITKNGGRLLVLLISSGLLVGPEVVLCLARRAGFANLQLSVSELLLPLLAAVLHPNSSSKAFCSHRKKTSILF